VTTEVRNLITGFGLALLPVVVACSAGQAQTRDRPAQVPIYFFSADGCPHCATQKVFLTELAAAYPEVEVREFEVRFQVKNRALFLRMAERAGIQAGAVPTTFIGDRVWVGFRESMGDAIEEAVVACIRSPCVDPGQGIVGVPDEVPAAPATDALHVPLIGAISLGTRSLGFSTAVIAFVDGFNPCSLWVLSILLALVLHTGSRRKIALVGGTFLLVTTVVYGLFIVGLFRLFTVIDFIGPIQAIVAVFALGFALVNIKDYFWYGRGFSFSISERHKPKIYRDIRTLLTPGKSTAALLGATVVMALGIALIELPCTAGFPVLWSNLVASHAVGALEFSLLLGLYLVIYLLDEVVVFGDGSLHAEDEPVGGEARPGTQAGRRDGDARARAGTAPRPRSNEHPWRLAAGLRRPRSLRRC
jgi:glutaredoxin